MIDLGAALLLTVLVGAVAGEARTRGARRSSAFPRFTVGALLIVGVPTVLQLTVAPHLLPLLERDADLIAHGEVWRLVTALVVQDGGVSGAVFNLVALLVVGLVAERRLGSRNALIAASVGAVAGELWGLAVQPIGAGSSVAVFGLAGAVAVSALLARDNLGRILAVIALAAGVGLILLQDIHGGAAGAGALVGAALSLGSHRKRGGSQARPRRRSASRRRSRR